MTPTAASGEELELSPLADLSAAAAEFQARGRVRLRNLLVQEAAERLHRCLSTEVPWKLAYDANGHAMVLDRSAPEVNDVMRRQKLMQGVMSQARQRFQYLYYSYPMVTAYLQGADPGLLLHRVLELLNTNETLDFVRRITGIATLRKADAQATLYQPGNFLTLHDDGGSPTEQRRVAYVLNLTRRWQPDWGGLLHFVNNDGEIVESWLPEFNVLVLFKVPVKHTVSYVAPFAGERRFAITGWFRDA
jgi:Rps23 Pro-64 3,4-dihydroxylase Tpa1-like proline 4-hydroxylase